MQVGNGSTVRGACFRHEVRKGVGQTRAQAVWPLPPGP